MKDFYSIFEGKAVPGSRLIDTLVDANGEEPRLTHGEVWEGDRLFAELYDPGFPLHYCTTIDGEAVVSDELRTAIEPLVGNHVQFIPIHIAEDDSVCYAWNLLKWVDCIDEARSEFVRTAPEQATRRARYDIVTSMRLDVTRISEDLHCFRAVGWFPKLIVSNTLLAAMQDVGCEALSWTPLT